jgi:LPS export ABC transporter protein LptC
MSRGQIRFLIATVALLLVTIVGYRVYKQMNTSESLPSDLTPPLTTTEQRMNDFKRVKVRPDGKKAWEIDAREARYSVDNHLVIVESPKFSFYPKDGDAFSVRSKEARVVLTSDKKEDVSRVELTGNLEMYIGDYIITTQEAIFETEQNRISSPAVVQIRGPGVEVTGQGYSVDVTNKYLTLDAAVQTTLSRSDS